MVSYFAGIFYLVRLFVYYKDTDTFEQPKKNILREQYVFMIRRLWNIITVPAGIIMLLAGLAMIFMNTGLMKTPWFHAKLTFLLGLGVYHFWCWKMIQKIKSVSLGDIALSNLKLRQANEVATFILFLVVFTVVLKHLAVEYAGSLFIGFIVIVVMIMFTVKLVNKNKKHQA